MEYDETAKKYARLDIFLSPTLKDELKHICKTINKTQTAIVCEGLCMWITKYYEDKK